LRVDASLSEAASVALRCLIVDDSEKFLASSQRLLESQGFDVVGTASSGAEAVRLAEAVRPDVVLVDVQLGEEDGLEVVRRLHESTPSAQLVLISSHSRDDLQDLISASPAVGFVPKTGLSAAAITGLLG
jgi:DNA-binding NarL/FixJ family response regulator